MKNLKNYGVLELNAQEISKTEGGLWAELAEFTYEFLSFRSEYGDDYSGSMHLIP